MSLFFILIKNYYLKVDKDSRMFHVTLIVLSRKNCAYKTCAQHLAEASPCGKVCIPLFAETVTGEQCRFRKSKLPSLI